MNLKTLVFPSLLMISCAGSDDAEKDLGPAWNAAELKELSGDCPEIKTSNELMSITSSGEQRQFRVLFPDEPTAPMNVIFFFHGFMDVDPSGYWSNAIGLQTIANDLNSVIVVPESTIWNLFGQEVYMWDVEEEKFDNDITLFDDLRTCTKQNFDVDLDKLSVIGVSGGALFTTVVLTERGDTLAAAVELSGGSDIEVPTYYGDFSAYETPASNTPSLLITGGVNDVWPNAVTPIVNFTEATDTLQEQLVEDGHLTVRCQHNYGHTVTAEALQNAFDWAYNHTYEETSPYQSSISAWSNWCEFIQ